NQQHLRCKTGDRNRTHIHASECGADANSQRRQLRRQRRCCPTQRLCWQCKSLPPMKKFRPKSAFSLVEVTLALGVAAFSLLFILGLLPISVKINQASSNQTVANGI